MNNALPLVLRLILAVCLTLYGPLAMAGAGGGASVTMEICANGAAQTVRVSLGTDAPASAAHECCDCTACGGGPDIDLQAPSSAQAAPNPAQLAQHAARPAAPAQYRNIRPLPRAPPAPRVSMQTHDGVIVCDHSTPGQDMRGSGRHLSKDASA
ncbi:hypothetical protein DC366_01610 [Pelagivirga sediminicola]|uniref:DUF2946 domain-containing protein n=2 Tax=Pelagivirga sediminicola TaxID=2170575 RepID=A0A2T7GB89_9RHOB|nr:hypothetical protein DC366_01610 [Pelagivirga sediminicola]